MSNALTSSCRSVHYGRTVSRAIEREREEQGKAVGGGAFLSVLVALLSLARSISSI